MKSNAFITNKNNRLGRGLDILLGPSVLSERVLLLDLEKIQPDKAQARKTFNKESLNKLCSSIKKNGLLQPILVQKRGENYQIIAGERRWRAACLAGLKKIPALLKNPSKKEGPVWSLIENLQREDLNPIETAQAFKKLMESENLSQESLAEKLGSSRSSVANVLRLLNLDSEVQNMLVEGKISFSQARELLKFKSPKEQREVAKACFRRSLTVKKLSQWDKDSGEKNLQPFWLKKILSRLERRFDQRLKFKYLKGKGQLVFSFQNEKELKRLLDKLL